MTKAEWELISQLRHLAAQQYGTIQRAILTLQDSAEKYRRIIDEYDAVILKIPLEEDTKNVESVV
jgi:hypothetical protein